MFNQARKRNGIFCKRYQRIASYTLLSIFLLLLCLYIITPIGIKYHLNHNVLRDMGRYTGHVNDVDLRLSRCGYSVQEMVLSRKAMDADTPFFYAQDFIVSISSEALRHGAVMVDVTIEHSELNFIDSTSPEKRQAGLGTNWLEVLREILPTTLHSMTIIDGKISFNNRDVKPAVALAASSINAHLSNLTNVLNRSQEHAASAVLFSQVQSQGQLEARATFNPDHFDDFSFVGKATGVKLVDFNDFANAYGHIDFQSGTGDVFIELEAADGELRGYAKPLFKNVSIASWEQDVKQQKDNPVQLIWEGALEIAKVLLTNQNTNTIATQIDIQGSISHAQMETWPTFVGMLKNAFVHALESNFDLDFERDSDHSETTDDTKDK